MILERPTWGEPTVCGSRRVLVDGVGFEVPEDAELRLVRGSRGIAFLHVRTQGRAYVLSRFGQLLEDETRSALRASKTAWEQIDGPKLT